MENCEKEGVKALKEYLLFLLCICFICTAFGVGYFYGSSNNNNTRPVEEIIKADSIIKVNDSIKIKVEQLDSIKDAKIIEVQTLDNDSTLKLFYELIG